MEVERSKSCRFLRNGTSWCPFNALCLSVLCFLSIFTSPWVLLAHEPTLIPVSFSALSDSDKFQVEVWNHRQELIKGIVNNLRFIDSSDGADAYDRVSGPPVGRRIVRASLLRLRTLLQTSGTSEALREALSREFQLYRSIGNDGAGTVKFTGYFQPTYHARRTATKEYRYPIYRAPKEFPIWPRPHPRRVALEGYEGLGTESSPIKGLEIAWLKHRYDAFMIHVQGSALLEYPDGSSDAVGFSHGTDHPFRGIPQSFLDQHQVPWPNLAQFFTTRPELLNQLLANNNRFIFFRTLPSNHPVGSIGVPVMPELSIATDKTYLPPGAIGLIRTKIPRTTATGTIELTQSSRLVLDQDTGSAIRGPGRVDLFMGSGEDARRKANMMYSTGELFYLLLKKSLEV